MEEFTNIYRYFTHKYLTSRGHWSNNEVDELKELLGPLAGLIENGDLLVNAWKTQLESQNVVFLNKAIKNIINGIIELENMINNKKKVNHIENFNENTGSFMIHEEKEKHETLNKKNNYKKTFENSKILVTYGTFSVYEVCVNAIMNELPNEFIHKDLTDFIEDYYSKHTGRCLSRKSYERYKSKYLKYLKLQGLLIEDTNRSPTIILKSYLDNHIYDKALEDRWNKRITPVSLDFIHKYFPGFSIDQIKFAIARLISNGKVSQRHNGIMFL